MLTIYENTFFFFLKIPRQIMSSYVESRWWVQTWWVVSGIAFRTFSRRNDWYTDMYVCFSRLEFPKETRSPNKRCHFPLQIIVHYIYRLKRNPFGTVPSPFKRIIDLLLYNDPSSVSILRIRQKLAILTDKSSDCTRNICVSLMPFEIKLRSTHVGPSIPAVIIRTS